MRVDLEGVRFTLSYTTENGLDQTMTGLSWIGLMNNLKTCLTYGDTITKIEEE